MDGGRVLGDVHLPLFFSVKSVKKRKKNVQNFAGEIQSFSPNFFLVEVYSWEKHVTHYLYV